MSGSAPHLLITGGCGFIGSNLIATLRALPGAAATTSVRVLDNESTSSREALTDYEVEFIHGDIRDLSAVTRAMAGIDCIIHLAADTRVIDSVADPAHNFATNVGGTLNVLHAMRNAGVTRIINASTGGALFGEATMPVSEDTPISPKSPYGASKAAVEAYLSAFSASYGLQACSLRFSNVYGPRSQHKGSAVAMFLRAILAGEPLVVYGDGSQTRDFVCVEDICRGILRALEREATGIYHLGTGVPTSINELIELIRSTVGAAHPLTVRHEAFRSGEARDSWCDIGKARCELDWRPQVALAEGLAQTWDWYQKETKL